MTLDPERIVRMLAKPVPRAIAILPGTNATGRANGRDDKGKRFKREAPSPGAGPCRGDPTRRKQNGGSRSAPPVPIET